MIYKGKKQDDGAKTLGDLEFKEGEFMVVMCAKVLIKSFSYLS